MFLNVIKSFIHTPNQDTYIEEVLNESVHCSQLYRYLHTNIIKQIIIIKRVFIMRSKFFAHIIKQNHLSCLTGKDELPQRYGERMLYLF